jgi:cell division protease FtsH
MKFNFLLLTTLYPFVNGYQQININSLVKSKYLFDDISYNSLITKINNHQIDILYFPNKLDEVLSHDTIDNSDKLSLIQFHKTTISPMIVDNLVDISTKNNIDTIFIPFQSPGLVESTLGGIVQIFQNYILPFVFLSTIISLFRFQQMNNGMGGGNGFMNGLTSLNNNIKKDKVTMQKANISLNSFAGSPEIFEECTEVVSYLKNGTLYQNAGAEIPRGILLEGPPGTGKTLLAKAIASEADANFISVAASEFVEIFVGVGASKIRGLFKQARENKPCIIFIDEIDAVGRQRGAGVNMANDEREQTLNQLLAEMDGFSQNDGILVMAATNRKDVLDSALLRPGRFDRIITVPFPDKTSRKAILLVHSKNKVLDKFINLDLISELTAGFSGAQLKNLMNEAAIFAARNSRVEIKETDIYSALDKLTVGLVRKTDTRSDDARRRVAIHETGHALLAASYPEYFELKKVSIQSTYNGAGGYTIFNEYQNITESGLYTKDLLKKRLTVIMGGKAAEYIFYGENHVSLGAIQDLKQANSLAQKMIGNFGMGIDLEVFYNENIDSDRNPFLGRSLGMGDKYSESTKKIMDKESLQLVIDAYETAKEILSTKIQKMNKVIELLIENENIPGNSVIHLLEL